jgi:hypothetical protein
MVLLWIPRLVTMEKAGSVRVLKLPWNLRSAEVICVLDNGFTPQIVYLEVDLM